MVGQWMVGQPLPPSTRSSGVFSFGGMAPVGGWPLVQGIFSIFGQVSAHNRAKANAAPNSPLLKKRTALGGL
jgi:hypothetical protein